MGDVTFQFWRNWAEDEGDQQRIQELHAERAELVHGLVAALDVDVRDWGATDDDGPHEVVEVVIALAPVIVPAVASIIKHWLESKKMKDVQIQTAGGQFVSVGAASREDIEQLIINVASR